MGHQVNKERPSASEGNCKGDTFTETLDVPIAGINLVSVGGMIASGRAIKRSKAAEAIIRSKLEKCSTCDIAARLGSGRIYACIPHLSTQVIANEQGILTIKTDVTPQVK